MRNDKIMLITDIDSKQELTNYVRHCFNEERSPTFNVLMVAIEEVIKKKDPLNDKNVSKVVKKLDENKCKEKLENKLYKEKISEDVIPKLSDVIYKKCNDYILNEETFIASIMRMLFGPSEFNLSSHIVHHGVFAESFDKALGSKTYLINNIIKDLNPALEGFNVKALVENIPLTEAIYGLDNIYSTIDELNKIDLNKLTVIEYYKLKNDYNVLNELDTEGVKNMASSAFNSFVGVLSKIGKFLTNQYDKLKYYWKDTFKLTTDITKQFQRLDDVKIFGRDGLRTVLDIPIEIVDDIGNTCVKIKDKAATIAKSSGISMDFSSLMKIVAGDSERLSNFVSKKFITQVGDHEVSFNQEMFIVYTKKVKHMINSMGRMYKSVMSVEKNLTSVKFSGDESKEQTYKDLKDTITMLRGLINDVEGAFNTMIQKYLSVLKYALQILTKMKDTPGVDKDDYRNKIVNPGSIQDIGGNTAGATAPDPSNDMDDITEALNTTFLYYVNVFTESEGMNRFTFDDMLKSYFNTSRLSSIHYSQLNEMMNTGTDTTAIVETLIPTLSKPILENIRSIRTTVFKNIGDNILIDGYGDIINEDTLNLDIEYIRELSNDNSSNRYELFEELQYKYDTIEVINSDNIYYSEKASISLDEYVNMQESDNSFLINTYNLNESIKLLSKENNLRINTSICQLPQLVECLEGFFKSITIDDESINYDIPKYIAKREYITEDVEYVYTDKEIVNISESVTSMLLTKECISFLEKLKEHSFVEYKYLVDAFDSITTELQIIV